MHKSDHNETDKIISGTLPPVETTPILYLRFTSKASKYLIIEIAARLQKVGIIITEGINDDDNDNDANLKQQNGVVLGLTTTQTLLENEAEIIKLVKPCRTNDANIQQIMEHFSVAARDNFIHVYGSIDTNNERFYDSFGLFSAAERVLLLQSMVNSIPALDSTHITTEGSGKKWSISTFHSILEEYSKSAGEDKSKLLLVTSLKSLGYVDVVCPVHIPHLREYILRDTINPLTPPPVQAIRNYYGEHVAFYFAWMDFSSKWIRFPGIIGLIVYCVRNYRGDTVDNCDLTPFVGIVTFFWATIYNRFWEREEASLAYQWGSYAVTNRDALFYGKRASFKGEARESPVTGRIEMYYSPAKCKLKCAVSVLLSMLIVVCPCILMVLFMNMQGYISADDAKWWEMDQGYSHPLYFPFFAKLAEPGGVFDASSSWKCFLPVILRAILVNLMNQMYRKVAVALTEWENHELVQHHENSLVLKRFAFEAFDAYVVLFYLAFYERNIHLLRLELVGAMSADTFRRVLTESVIPYAIQKLPAGKDNLSTKKDDDTSAEQDHSAEVDMDEYEVFDDYIEMLINFGYITLFASAFPLASFVTIFANVIEYRSDCWKLRLVNCVILVLVGYRVVISDFFGSGASLSFTQHIFLALLRIAYLTHIFINSLHLSRVFRRPTVVKTDSIGMWKHLLQMLVSLSALTNCLIFAFTSSQLQQFIPESYVTDQFGKPALKTGAAEETMLLMLGMEHSLIVLAALVKSVVPSVPQHVKNGISKRDYLYQALLAKGRLQTMEVFAKAKAQCLEKTEETSAGRMKLRSMMSM